jgi:hypothetical protein
MLRIALASVTTSVIACAPHLAPQPLPPLVATARPSPAGGGTLVIPGEHLIWEVAADGVTIGRAEMIVRPAEIESRFQTDGIASMFADVHEHLITPIADASGVYTLHTALAWLRAWHPTGSSAARLAITYDGDRYAVTCEPPIPDELHDARVVRIACSVATSEPVMLTVQLADDSDRVPMRVVAKIGTTNVEANLVLRDLRGSAATPVARAHTEDRATR